MKIKYGTDLLKLCNDRNQHIYEIALEYEHKRTDIPKEEILSKMHQSLNTMRNAATSKDPEAMGKIIGGESQKLQNHAEKNNPICGHIMSNAIAYALKTMEVNASMGQIVAAPTAGSCGIIPAVLLSLSYSHHLSDDELVKALLTASAIGMIIGQNATLSGAQGGCQAEVGSAAAMAAGAACEIMGGSPAKALHAASIALKNLMGLICDPIAGLVEAPCSKRNAIGTANALISAEMALAGIESVIPFDEVVEAMYKVGLSMPCSLRETAEGGIAATETARRIEKEIFS